MSIAKMQNIALKISLQLGECDSEAAKTPGNISLQNLQDCRSYQQPHIFHKNGRHILLKNYACGSCELRFLKY